MPVRGNSHVSSGKGASIDAASPSFFGLYGVRNHVQSRHVHFLTDEAAPPSLKFGYTGTLRHEIGAQRLR